MPQLVFTLEDKSAAKIVRSVRASGKSTGLATNEELAPPRLSGRWRRAVDGAPIGKDFALNVHVPRTLEYPGPDGLYTGSKLPAAVSFSALPPPTDAASLEVRVDGRTIVEVAATSLLEHGDRLPEPSTHRLGKDGAATVIPVFSERFTDEPRFLGAVAQLLSWIETQTPFNEDKIRGKLAFDAHFWASDPVSGLFGTDDSRNHHQQEFYGNLALARELLAPWVGSGVSLILIDSSLRGGAGGQPGGYSAWASIASAPGEHWEAIGLHEVGHAFGLADEYLYDERANEWPAQFEPNVSQNSVPSQTSWAASVTVGDSPAPTAGLNSPAIAETVGTFQGARYRKDLYRPSSTCLMRQTGAPFCKVCAGHIREKLTH